MAAICHHQNLSISSPPSTAAAKCQHCQIVDIYSHEYQMGGFVYTCFMLSFYLFLTAIFMVKMICMRQGDDDNRHGTRSNLDLQTVKQFRARLKRNNREFEIQSRKEVKNRMIHYLSHIQAVGNNVKIDGDGNNNPTGRKISRLNLFRSSTATNLMNTLNRQTPLNSKKNSISALQDLASKFVEKSRKLSEISSNSRKQSQTSTRKRSASIDKLSPIPVVCTIFGLVNGEDVKSNQSSNSNVVSSPAKNMQICSNQAETINQNGNDDDPKIHYNCTRKSAVFIGDNDQLIQQSKQEINSIWNKRGSPYRKTNAILEESSFEQDDYINNNNNCNTIAKDQGSDVKNEVILNVSKLLDDDLDDFCEYFV